MFSILPFYASVAFTLSMQCKLMETMVCVHLDGIKMLTKAWWAPLHPPLQSDNLLLRTTNQLSKMQPVLPGLPQGMTAAPEVPGGSSCLRRAGISHLWTRPIHCRFCAPCQPLRQEAPNISAQHSALGKHQPQNALRALVRPPRFAQGYDFLRHGARKCAFRYITYL